MGMCLVYCKVSPRNAKTLLSDPSLIHDFLDPESEYDPALESRVDGDEGDTDKSWNAIHYLLTGSSEGGSFPESFLLEGGTPIGDEDVGYGPARVFDPEELSQIVAMLDRHDEESLRARYDGEAMDREEVYPQIWNRKDEDNFEYVWENFLQLREFSRLTLQENNHLMVLLT